MSNESYIQAQFDKLQLSDTWHCRLQICDPVLSRTNFINITNEQVEQIKQILLQGASDEPL